MECKAAISGAVGEWDIEEIPLPDAFTDACNLWADAQDAETGIKILGMLKPFLKANFIPMNLENPSDIIPGDPEEEYDALEVIPLAFEYSGDGDCVPIIKAKAIFDIPFKDNISKEGLVKWEAENDEDLAWAVNFYWEVDEEAIFLDTNSGTQFYTEFDSP